MNHRQLWSNCYVYCKCKLAIYRNRNLLFSINFKYSSKVWISSFPLIKRNVFMTEFFSTVNFYIVFIYLRTLNGISCGKMSFKKCYRCVSTKRQNTEEIGKNVTGNRLIFLIEHRNRKPLSAFFMTEFSSRTDNGVPPALFCLRIIGMPCLS